MMAISWKEWCDERAMNRTEIAEAILRNVQLLSSVAAQSVIKIIPDAINIDPCVV